jgi:hypothetical protein
VSAVLQAVRLIAENCGSTPVKAYRHLADGKEAAKNHPAYRIVHRAANEWTSAAEFRSMLTTDALMHGGGFARVVRYDDGRPFELHRLEPGKTAVMQDEATGAPVYRVSEDRGQVDYPYTEILHLRPFGNASPIALGKEAIGIAVVLEQHTGRLFGSGAMPNPGRRAALAAHKKLHEPYLAKVEENHATDLWRAGPGREDHNRSKREDREEKAKEDGRPFKPRNSKRTPEQKTQQQAEADARHYQKNTTTLNPARSERRRRQREREKQERQRQEEAARAAMLEGKPQF